jgi:hypothetical protein
MHINSSNKKIEIKLMVDRPRKIMFVHAPLVFFKETH